MTMMRRPSRRVRWTTYDCVMRGWGELGGRCKGWEQGKRGCIHHSKPEFRYWVTSFCQELYMVGLALGSSLWVLNNSPLSNSDMEYPDGTAWLRGSLARIGTAFTTLNQYLNMWNQI
jgi:hypothetical protein